MRIIIFIISLCFTFILRAQCPTEEIQINSQQELQAFVDQYPNCHKLDYKLTLGVFNDTTDIHDLSPLAQFDSLDILYITNCDSLNDLKQLSHITYLEGINVNRSENITDLQGLENIQNELFHLGIFDNPNLESLEGLQNIDSVIHNIGIESNPKLQSIEALINIRHIDFRIEISDCPKLESFKGLNNLRTIGDWFKINNLGIRSMEGLESLHYIHRNFRIAENDSLSSFHGLSSLTTVGPDDFYGVPFEIIGNGSLKNLEGLENVTDIKLNFSLLANKNLVSLKGLENLERNYGLLRIKSHLTLTDLSAIANLDQIGEQLFLLDNYVLVECAEPSICKYILENRPYLADDNDGYCETEETLRAQCLSITDNDMDGYTADVDCNDGNPNINPGVVEIPDNNVDENCDGIIGMTTAIDHIEDHDFVMYPNPTSSFFILRASNGFEKSMLTIYNSFGKTVYHKAYDATREPIKVFLPDLANGVYHVQIAQNEKVVTKRMLVN